MAPVPWQLLSLVHHRWHNIWLWQAHRLGVWLLGQQYWFPICLLSQADICNLGEDCKALVQWRRAYVVTPPIALPSGDMSLLLGEHLLPAMKEKIL